MTTPDPATAGLTVMISGGFALAYQEILPDIQRRTGLAVTTLSGASQGRGPSTIRHQLAQGAEVDVVILSNEGLRELVEDDRIRDGSAVELATAPLAAAVRTGSPRPDIGSVAALRRSLSEARLVVMPGSTSGRFILGDVFSRLGIAGTVRAKIVPRGTDSAAALAAGEADIALGPVSELVHVPGIEVVGALPDEVQLVQSFAAAITRAARNPDGAKRLIDVLASERALPAIARTGMRPVGRPA